MEIDLKTKIGQDEMEDNFSQMGDKFVDHRRRMSDLEFVSLNNEVTDEGKYEDSVLDDDYNSDEEEESQRKDSDHILNNRESFARQQLNTESENSLQVKVSSQLHSVPYGLIPRGSYEHGKRNTDIMGVTYNGRMRQFIILDSKGITTWKRDAVENIVNRALCYPKYEYRLITNVVYAKKYNCYFILGKDFSLKVYNRDFYETCSVSADLRSVLFLLFNPVRDELITGGVGGTKVWCFHQQPGKASAELKPLANYGLTLKYELPNVGGSWVKKVELDYHLEHLYCCSDTDLYVYDLDGKRLFNFERAHGMSITGCRYSRNASVLVTSSVDCEVKVWSLLGGLVHTFRGHSRAVTNLILHPATSSIVITSSLDGTVRMWSLDTMDNLYSLVVSVDGVLWMGLTDDSLLYLSTPRAVTLWSLNYNVQFWALARSRVTQMSLCGCRDKSTRLMAVSEDSSVRLMAISSRKNLTTVLPPPNISPLQQVLCVSCSREFNTIYMLINPREVWVYTTRTDPCCRIAVWYVLEIQARFLSKRPGTPADGFNPSMISVNKPASSHRATETGIGNEVPAHCCCVAILNSAAMVWTDKGFCCPIRDSYLLLGLEDGRILFMDPVIKGRKYLEFKTGKDPVLGINHDVAHHSLLTLYKVEGVIQIHVWSLPDLLLEHEIYTAPDLSSYARVGYTLVTGHESGCVFFHPLQHAVDPGLHKARMFSAYEDVVAVSHKPEHSAPVMAVDVCVTLKIFCSCSTDGAIKIWSEDNVLLSEVVLDSSMSSACFLNEKGDLVVGYQKHIFFIDHTKLCPQLTVIESDAESCDKESYIHEDPAVLYEGVTANPDPVTLENYLVPFDIEFSKDFLEGRGKLEPEVVKEEESDDESQASRAPTEIYLSPLSTPRSHLSLIDLTLSSEVSKYDLLKHMKKKLDHLTEKANHKEQRQQMYRSNDDDGVDEETEGRKYDGGEEMERRGGGKRREQIGIFSFPKFGKSPGPTPETSRSATPVELLSEKEEEEEGKHPVEEAAKLVVTKDILPPVHREKKEEISHLVREKEEKLDLGNKSSTGSSVPRNKFGFSDVVVDARTLMKKVAVPGLPTLKDTFATESVQKIRQARSRAGERKTEGKDEKPKKKMVPTSQRKHAKQKKSEKMSSEKQDYKESPPTLMQALELREATLDARSEDNDAEVTAQSSNLTEERDPDLLDKTFENRSLPPAVSGRKTLASVVGEDYVSSIARITVPELPSVPAEKDVSRPSTSKCRSATAKPGPVHKGIDFGSAIQKESMKSGASQNAGMNETASEHAIHSRAMTAGSSDVPVEDVYMVLTEDNRTAYRISCGSVECTYGVEDMTSNPFAGLASVEISDGDIMPVSTQQNDHSDVEKYRQSTLYDQAFPEDFLSNSEVLKAKIRPVSSFQDRLLEKSDAIKYLQQRPYTAHTRFTNEDLQAVFDTSLRRYEQMVRSQLASDKLYRNDDQAFSDHWHERQIERHMLLRMQKQLRVHNAQMRRQHIQLQKQEKWSHNIKKRHVTVIRDSVSQIPPPVIQKASTVHGSQPSISIPAPTPVSSRPHTATGGYDKQQKCPLQAQTHMSSSAALLLHQSQHRQAQLVLECPTLLQESEVELKWKTELSYEKAFRFRLREPPPQEQHTAGTPTHSESQPSIDLQLLDPRNPCAIRPKSSKSIPSKCQQYILLTRPKVKLNLPVPTSLEEQLLVARFPEQSKKVFRQYESLLLQPPKRPYCGIGYSPYEHHLYG